MQNNYGFLFFISVLFGVTTLHGMNESNESKEPNIQTITTSRARKRSIDIERQRSPSNDSETALSPQKPTTNELVLLIQNNEATTVQHESALDIVCHYARCNGSEIENTVLPLFTALVRYQLDILISLPFINQESWLADFITMTRKLPHKIAAQQALLKLIIEIILQKNQTINSAEFSGFSSSFLTAIRSYALASLYSPHEKTRTLSTSLFSGIMYHFKKIISCRYNDQESILRIHKYVGEVLNPTRAEGFYSDPYRIEHPEIIQQMALETLKSLVGVKYTGSETQYYANLTTTIKFLQIIMFSKNKPTIKDQTSLIIEDALCEIYTQFNQESIDIPTKSHLDYKLTIIATNYTSYSTESINYLCYFIANSDTFYQFDNQTIHEILLSLFHTANTHPLTNETVMTVVNTIIQIINTFDLSTSNAVKKLSKVLITCLNIMQALVDHGDKQSPIYAEHVAKTLYTSGIVPEIDYQVAWLLISLIKKDHAVVAAQDMLIERTLAVTVAQETLNQITANNPTSSQKEANRARSIAQKEISFYHSWLQLKKLMQNKGLID